MTIALQQFPDGHRLTNSQISTFRTCQRKEYYRNRLGVAPENSGKALRFGTMIHLGIELVAKGLPLSEATKQIAKQYESIRFSGVDDPRNIEMESATVICLTNAYHWWWSCDTRTDLLVATNIATEEQFEVKIPYQKRVFAGKIDGIVRLGNGQVALRETKTTSEDCSPSSDYYARLRIDNQISGYVVAAKSLNVQIDTILYDIIRKPTIRPYSATPVESRKYTKEGKLYANQREHDETPDEFYTRLSADIISEPTKYFYRYNIPRLESDLQDWKDELIDTMREMDTAYKSGRAPRNTAACLAYGRCPYLDVCHSGIVEGGSVPPGFRIANKSHEELE